ncbi:MAG: adenosylcobinamide-phosphate synthase CbiB [Candidatus Binatia bacterium]
MGWQALLESSAVLLIGAFLLDLATGDPRWLPHPVVLMGKFISLGERLFWSGKPQRDFLAGMVVTLALITVSAGAAWALALLFTLLPPLLFFLFTVALASTTLATRGLIDTVGRVETLLHTGDLTEARKELSHIVGRETHSLSEDKILRASLESLAENTCDGIVAPLFYLCLGGVPLAMIYKAVNTLDSMIGYRTERYLYFGRFAARLDDLLNFIPARLTALFIVVAAYLMRLDGARALRVLRRDHDNHLSPNAGYPEAALAGAFGIRLGGPSVYFGQEIWKPHIGEETTGIHMNMLKEGRWLGLITATLSLITFLLLLRLSFGHF